MSNQADVLQAEYRMRFAELAEYRNEVWKIICDDYLSRLIPPDSCVLDLGAGWGEFINNISASKKYAMDLNADTGLRVSGGTEFLQQDSSQKWQIDAGSLDVVFTSNFIEHLSGKRSAESTVSEAYRCLKEDGLIICLGPNVKYLAGDYWDFWDHIIPISDLSMSELLKLKGFRIECNIPRFLPYSMSTVKLLPLCLIKIYLKLPVLWPLLGKQFLVVGKKSKIVEEIYD